MVIDEVEYFSSGYEDISSERVVESIPELKEKYRELSCYCKAHDLNGIHDKLQSKLQDLSEPLYIMIVGIGNHGKSTLINALVNKKVAEVAIRPKTWKIDIYQSTDEEEYAELTWIKDDEIKVEKTTIEKATEISQELEKVQKTHSKLIEEWRSDLRQVKWFINSSWPGENSVLIDTPGFNQLRADTSIKLSTLYNAKGIQVEREDGFSYYYYRADVVLWCIRAGKLQDRETLEKLEEVYSQNKLIIGIITAIDLIPEDRREDIKKEAQKLYGKYMCNFVLSAAGSKDAILKESTIKDIKDVVERVTVGNEDSVKIKDATQFYHQQLNSFKMNLSNIADVYVKNTLKYYDVLNYVKDKPQEFLESAQSKLRVALKTEYSNLTCSFDAVWESSEGDPERFSNRIQSSIKNSRIQQKIKAYLETFDSENKALTQYVRKNTNWTILKLSSKNSKEMNLVDSTIDFNEQELDIGEFSIQMNVDDDRKTAVLVSGLAGAFLLGPIGLALGGLGFLYSGYAKKRKCINSAQEHIRNFIDNIDNKLNESLTGYDQNVSKNLNKYLSSSFKEYNGGTPSEVIERVESIEIDFNALNLYAKENLEHIVLGIGYPLEVNGFHIGKTKYIRQLMHLPEMKKIKDRKKRFIDTLIKELINNTKGIYLEYSRKAEKTSFSLNQSLYEQLGIVKYHEMNIGDYPIIRNNDLNRFNDIFKDEYFKTGYEEACLELKSFFDLNFGEIEKKWNQRVKKAINKEIDDRLSFISYEYSVWQKKARIIVDNYEVENYKLLEFSEFLRSLGIKELVDFRLNRLPEENVKKHTYNWKWADGNDCSEYINLQYRKISSQLKLKLNDTQFSTEWDNRTKKHYTMDLVRVLIETKREMDIKDAKKLFKIHSWNTVSELIEKKKSGNESSSYYVLGTTFRDHFDIGDYLNSLFPENIELQDRMDRSILDLPLINYEKKLDMTDEVFSEIIDGIDLKGYIYSLKSYDFNKTIDYIALFTSIGGVLAIVLSIIASFMDGQNTDYISLVDLFKGINGLPIFVILIVLGLSGYLYRIIDKRNVFKNWFEKIDNAISRYLNELEENTND
ncbi:Dynamin family protein [Dethiosulfatibacter aminovorans DSM 17477]|uniref:Dynamin family protein n=1 Tax=Dethiosulfatibacter aminovorans DSM 17477 TaxID=1121476 RepID=A0A1M6IGA1_9FIRM|nr:dynamin family protein [Dethiosulfatibacter aminovorans]SHJ33471.1 Dynamin family protein [Dethiosulfatibacter aminovorans DSM 17477]